MKLIQEKENKLFNRKELVYETSFSGTTPKKEEIKKSISEISKSSEDLIVIDKIHQVYGAKTARINAKIYKTPEELKKVEVINKKPKKKAEEPKKQ